MPADRRRTGVVRVREAAIHHHRRDVRLIAAELAGQDRNAQRRKIRWRYGADLRHQLRLRLRPPFDAFQFHLEIGRHARSAKRGEASCTPGMARSPSRMWLSRCLAAFGSPVSPQEELTRKVRIRSESN